MLPTGDSIQEPAAAPRQDQLVMAAVSDESMAGDSGVYV